MPKILKNNIIALIFFAITLVVGVTIGVVANTNSNKNVQFNLGIQYKPELEFSIKIGTETIFNSSAPVLNSPYIYSASGDLMKLNESALPFDSNNQLTLTFENFHNDLEIKVVVNGDTDGTLRLGAVGVGTPTDTYIITKSTSGMTVVNLNFEGATAWYKVNFDKNDGTGIYETKYFSNGDAYSLPTNPIHSTNSALEFVGWNTASDGSGTTITEGQTVALSGDVTYYAIYELPMASIKMLPKTSILPYLSLDSMIGHIELNGEVYISSLHCSYSGCEFNVPINSSFVYVLDCSSFEAVSGLVPTTDGDVVYISKEVVGWDARYSFTVGDQGGTIDFS